MKDILNKINMIYEHFGYENQMNKLYEEMIEYKSATDIENEREEMCDIWVVLTGILFGKEEKENSKKIIDFKIKRTLRRIKDKYYEDIGEV